MCGIAGAVASGEDPTTFVSMAGMLRAMERRGPTSSGEHRWPTAVFGHQRLAIIDLSDAGAQPMISSDGEIGVVFNGCIYNFAELKKELEANGCSFRSNCDTEVLLEGYRAWGMAGLTPRLRGMFAFGVWDERNRKLSLARDRLGVKPLIYAVADGRIVFASTTRAIRRSGWHVDIDPQAVLAFLEFGYIPEDLVIYKGVHKLQAGTILEWQDGRVDQKRYWQLPDPDERLRISFREAVEETERILLDAAAVRLCSDVPIAALLSAGVDSSLVCWAYAKLNRDIQTFTVSTPGDPADEAPQAQETANRLGLTQTSITLPESSPDELLDELTNAYGEPFGCSSALGMIRVSEAIAPNATVVLTGDGGDDVFLGYPEHRHWHYAQRIARVVPVAAARLWPRIRPAVRGEGSARRLRHFTDYAAGGIGAVIQVHDGLPYFDVRDMLGARLASLSLPQRNIQPVPGAGRSLVLDCLRYDQDMRFRSEYLTKVDGGSMYHSLEARSPFLDQQLWDFAARLPTRIRLHGGVLKAILRQIAAERLGRDVAYRRKQGFTIPVGEWLASRWRDSLRILESGSQVAEQGWIEAGSLRTDVRKSLDQGRVAVQLWYVLVLERWLAVETREPA